MVFSLSLSPTSKNFLKCESGSNVLEFLGHLGRGPVQLLGDALLLGRLQIVVLLAEVPVNHVLHGVVVRSGILKNYVSAK